MMSATPHFLQRAYWFGQVDSRPLSLFRIGFGALLLKQTLYLIPVAQLFYSDQGIVPRAQFWADPAQAGLGQFSLLNYAGSGWLAILCFGVWAAIAIALLVGYQTRTMGLLNYLFALSLLHRNPFSLHAPDHVLLLLSFWTLFLPLNHHYAVDSWQARRRAASASEADPCLLHTTYAFPLRTIQIQVALIYSLTSYSKWQGLFWREGDALYYTLQQTSFLLPTGAWLGGHASLWLLHRLTWSTLLIEASFAPLVFAPMRQPWMKAIGLTLAALLHLGIAFTMAIPDFSIVMGISYLLFFEPSWVIWLERQLRRWLNLALARAPMACDSANVESRQSRSVPSPGKVTRLPTAKHSLLATVWQWALTLLLALLLTVTVWGSFAADTNAWGQTINALNHQLHLASPWSMFAYPSVPRPGWLIIDGAFENGTHALLYSGMDPTTGRANWLWGPGARLRFFEQRLLWAFPDTILQAWGGYYCQLYNALPAHGVERRLATVEIHRHYRLAHAPGAPPNPYEDDLLWRHQCLSH